MTKVAATKKKTSTTAIPTIPPSTARSAEAPPESGVRRTTGFDEPHPAEELINDISRELDWVSYNFEEITCGETGTYEVNAARSQLTRTRGMLANLRTIVDANYRELCELHDAQPSKAVAS